MNAVENCRRRNGKQDQIFPSVTLSQCLRARVLCDEGKIANIMNMAVFERRRSASLIFGQGSIACCFP